MNSNPDENDRRTSYKKYYDTHKEYFKKYYQDRKDHWNNYTPKQCECGMIVNSLWSHKKTRKHIEIMEILERAKQQTSSLN